MPRPPDPAGCGRAPPEGLARRAPRSPRAPRTTTSKTCCDSGPGTSSRYSTTRHSDSPPWAMSAKPSRGGSDSVPPPGAAASAPPTPCPRNAQRHVPRQQHPGVHVARLHVSSPRGTPASDRRAARSARAPEPPAPPPGRPPAPASRRRPRPPAAPTRAGTPPRRPPAPRRPASPPSARPHPSGHT